MTKSTSGYTTFNRRDPPSASTPPEYRCIRESIQEVAAQVEKEGMIMSVFDTTHTTEHRMAANAKIHELKVRLADTQAALQQKQRELTIAEDKLEACWEEIVCLEGELEYVTKDRDFHIQEGIAIAQKLFALEEQLL